jgi:DnaJ-class molecular chaperone
MKRPMMECLECNGKGEVTHLRFGSAYKTTCKFCAGLGKVNAPSKSSHEISSMAKPERNVPNTVSRP